MKKYTVIVARISLGLIFVVFGLNGFFLFIEPPEHTTVGGAFINLLVSTGLMYFEKSLETVAGALLLSNQFTPLALSVLAPIVVNILLFHLLMERHSLAAGIVPFGLWAYLFWQYRSFFAALFVRDAKL